MNTIEIKNLTKIYKQDHIEVAAVKDITINFVSGEFTSLVGPSGSGKTTLLNMLGGLDKPTSGEVYINQTRIDNLKTSELTDFRLKNIGFVFQSYNLIPVLTAMENTEFIMSLLKWPKKERLSRAVSLLESVGLGYLGDSSNGLPLQGRLRLGQNLSLPMNQLQTSTLNPPKIFSILWKD